MKGVRFNDPVTLCTENLIHILGEYILLGIKNCFTQTHRKNLTKIREVGP